MVVDVPRKSDVWFTYGLFMLRAGFAKTEILSYKSFLHLWNDEFAWLKTRKAKTVDSGCTTCEDLEVMCIDSVAPSRCGGFGAVVQRTDIGSHDSHYALLCSFPWVSCMVAGPAEEAHAHGSRGGGNPPVIPI